MPKVVLPVVFADSLPSQVTWNPSDNTFVFLNLSHTFRDRVDWRFNRFGKLWTYNLHYFEYLHDRRISKEAGVRLIHDFIDRLPNTPEALEPYPTSLRIIFWLRFLAAHQINDAEIDASLYAQSCILADQIEYHLLGNHLLENGFGLYFAAYRFRDDYLYRKATGILMRELDEQILPDGGHFERSPMYHQIILYRLLDCLNLGRSNADVFTKDRSGVLHEKASRMLGWLEEITFSNGAVPLFNDTAFGVAPSSESLMEYARQLEVGIPRIPLKESGYRKLSGTGYDLIMDAGEIGPDYIPGHAHSDTLSFELYLDGKPFIVDTGISTYEKNERRQYERSTAAHNTVQLDDWEQSEIWGGFRVARRARPVILDEQKDMIRASHTGYDALGVRHVRTFSIQPGIIQISDDISPIKKGAVPRYNISRAHLHFHHQVIISEHGKDLLKTDRANIVLKGCTRLEMLDYEYAPAFNRRVQAKKVILEFRNELQITVRLV